MNILIVHQGHIPVTLYGGTERVIWHLAKALKKLGHNPTFLVPPGSSCDFAPVLPLDESKEIASQIPSDIDVVHFHYTATGMEKIEKPYVLTIHGNPQAGVELDQNSIFVSGNHASRYGSNSFVHNGMDWDDQPQPDLQQARNSFHFLGKAAWRVKNVKGAIEVIRRTKQERLDVLGGVRFNVKMGLRFTFSQRISFFGMVGGVEKYKLINQSKGLIFPVRWHEPFGLAITESLYYGCPVFGTPYGSLPELVSSDVGFLSNKADELAAAVEHSEDFSKTRCQEYARENFNAEVMARAYLDKYQQVLKGNSLNEKRPTLQNNQVQKFLEWHS